MSLTPERAVLEFKRQGAFDEMRKELLDTFLSSERGKKFNERLLQIMETRENQELDLFQKECSVIHGDLMNTINKSQELEKVGEYILKEVLESEEYQALFREKLERIIGELLRPASSKDSNVGEKREVDHITTHSNVPSTGASVSSPKTTANVKETACSVIDTIISLSAQKARNETGTMEIDLPATGVQQGERRVIQNDETRSVKRQKAVSRATVKSPPKASKGKDRTTDSDETMDVDDDSDTIEEQDQDEDGGDGGDEGDDDDSFEEDRNVKKQPGRELSSPTGIVAPKRKIRSNS